MKLFTRTGLPALILSLILPAGCIKEDLSDCPAGLKVCFTYEPATYARTGVDPLEVDRIDLFVFDAQDIFRGVWIDENPVLSPDYYMTIDRLPAGDYHFIAWGGMHGSYTLSHGNFVTGQTTFNEARLMLGHNGGIAGRVSPLFHAGKTEYIGNRQQQTIYLPLVQAYNTINLTTEGLQPNTDTYRMVIHDNNGIYNFDYSFAGDSEFTYMEQCSKNSGGQLLATLNILKLAAGRNPVFEIRDETQGTILYRENLVALINAAGSINYDNIHTYDIHLRFGLSVSVSINGWWVVNDGELVLN